jgi:hypothetical protein
MLGRDDVEEVAHPAVLLLVSPPHEFGRRPSSHAVPLIRHLLRHPPDPHVEGRAHEHAQHMRNPLEEHLPTPAHDHGIVVLGHIQ